MNVFAALPALASSPPIALPSSTGASASTLKADYGALPLSFEPNRGQADSRVRFVSRGNGYSLFLTPTEAVFDLKPVSAKESRGNTPGSSVLRMRLLGADPNASSTGQERLPGRVSYFRGRPKEWRTNLSTYAKARFSKVYPGVDVVYYGNQRRLEYDFIVSPNSDPGRIRLGFEGAKTVRVDAHGDLVLGTFGTPVIHHRPVVYQNVHGIRRSVPGRYTLLAKNRVGFKVGPYDRKLPLVIDPVLSYATYIGGTVYESANGIAVDKDGNALIVGTTTSLDFPTIPYAPREAGRYGANEEAFVVKLNPSGTEVLYSAYLGGNRHDRGIGIAVDGAGNAYVTGKTESIYDPGDQWFPPTTGFPTTDTAYDPNGNSNDAFLSKINADGTALLYSTLIGSGSEDVGNAVAVDDNGNAYVGGMTHSRLDPNWPDKFQNFPTTEGAIQREYGGEGLLDGDGFVAKFNTKASGAASLVYSTYFGGNGGDAVRGIAVDGTGNATVVGMTSSNNLPVTPGTVQPQYVGGGVVFAGDGFVAKLNATGTGLLYGTYLGGGNGEYLDAVALDAEGNAWVTGTTYSSELDQLYPVTPGAFQTGKSLDTCTDPWWNEDGELTDVGRERLCSDVVLSKLNPTGTQLLYSTYLGGNFVEEGHAIALDGEGNVYVAGRAQSTNFKVTSNLKFILPGGDKEGFVAKMSPAGQFAWITQTSARPNAMAVSRDGNVYLTGTSWKDTLPVTPGAPQPYSYGGGDAFVARISPADAPWIPASQYYTFDATGGVLKEGDSDTLGLYVRATPPSAAAYQIAPKVEVYGPNDEKIAAGTVYFRAGVGTVEMDHIGVELTPGDYRAVFIFDDALITKPFTLSADKSAPDAPTVQADSFNDGSLRLAWNPAGGAQGYFIEVYKIGRNEQNQETLGLLYGGLPNAGNGTLLPAGLLEAGEQYAAFVYALSMDPAATSLPQGYAGTRSARVNVALGTQPPPQFGKGDLNKDSKVNVSDAILALRASVGMISLPPDQITLGDMDGNGKVDVADAVAILKKAVGQ